jgi:hypothetical protein
MGTIDYGAMARGLANPRQAVAFGTAKKIPVIGMDGKQAGEVSANATSLGASKITGVPMQFSNSGGNPSWVPVPKR